MRRTLILTLTLILTFTSTAHADVSRGDTGPEVRQVQMALRWFGYSVAADGVFGKQTEKAVLHWQNANGLTVDGVVGPITAGSLGIRGEQIQVTTPPAPPAVGAGLTGCPEMQAYRIAAGLPEQFDAIGYRESRCRNSDEVRTFCCYGYWQNFISSHLSRQSAYRQRIIDECGVTGADDINSDTPDDKRRQACVTYVVWSISGMSPWRTS